MTDEPKPRTRWWPRWRTSAPEPGDETGALDRLKEDGLSGKQPGDLSARSATEASSDSDVYRIGIELPGVAEEDIHLTVDDGVVTVTGEKKTEHEEKGDTWYFSERQFGSFSRSFRLPPDADDAGVKAALKDGVLTVTVPRRKAEEMAKAKRVPIARG